MIRAERQELVSLLTVAQNALSETQRQDGERWAELWLQMGRADAYLLAGNRDAAIQALRQAEDIEHHLTGAVEAVGPLLTALGVPCEDGHLDGEQATAIRNVLDAARGTGDEPTIHLCHVALGQREPGSGGQQWPFSREQSLPALLNADWASCFGTCRRTRADDRRKPLPKTKGFTVPRLASVGELYGSHRSSAASLRRSSK